MKPSPTDRRLKDGTWFNEFVRAMLSTYAERIMSEGGIEYFRRRYPGLPRDRIAQEVVDLAVNYATVAGAASGAASTAAFAATIGTAGGAAVVSVPAAVTTIGAEILWTTRLQLRMVYDLATVYGYPIDLDDPTDLYRAFQMAFGVQAAATGGMTVKTFAPEVARSAVRGVIHGHTPLIQQAARRVLGPRIGRRITQKAILRSTLPVAGIVVSGVWNRVTTQSIGTACRHDLRALGRVRDAVRDLGDQLTVDPTDYPLVIDTMLVVIGADGIFDEREREVFNRVVEWLDVPREVLESIEDRVDVNLNSLDTRLRMLRRDEREPLCRTLATCMRLMAVSEGRISDTEVAVLRRLYDAIAQPLDLDALRLEAEFYRTPGNLRGRVAGTARQTLRQGARAAADAKAKATDFGNRFRRQDTPDAVTSPAEGTDIGSPGAAAEDDDADLHVYDVVLAKIRKLAELHADGIVDDSEFQAKKDELLAQLA
jgi:hypothetical protein